MGGTVNMVLQGKGGVGKSVVAALFAQRLADLGTPALCIDTDPVNATLASYGRLAAHRFQVSDGEDIDRSKFDLLLENLSQLVEGGHAVVDTGATTFVPLSAYMLRFDVPQVLTEMGHRLVIHTVIAGGKPQLDTGQGLFETISNYGADVDIVVWLNQRFGVIEHEGKPFSEWKLYRGHSERIRAVIDIPCFDPLSTSDLELMFKRNQTLSEALESADLLLMQRQRLRLFQKALYQSIDRAELV